ncbi:hypothetical protein [Dysgonomonas sp. 511]|uniref:hypothetical protein n=1 Tax=Dysgonomonas sp. 511 TaxID=2302930 RepID=UPI0013CF72CE|nr:hypothetical protein [Dysgonomonas sp. 511]NDV78710.1 hypothetical protein [Dysgonomonas sp. 511]
MKYTNFDYLYAIFMFLFGIFMIVSPGSVIRKAKYDEERIKTESWVRKTGIVFCVLGVIFGTFIYTKLNA